MLRDALFFIPSNLGDWRKVLWTRRVKIQNIKNAVHCSKAIGEVFITLLQLSFLRSLGSNRPNQKSHCFCLTGSLKHCSGLSRKLLLSVGKREWLCEVCWAGEPGGICWNVIIVLAPVVNHKHFMYFSPFLSFKFLKTLQSFFWSNPLQQSDNKAKNNFSRDPSLILHVANWRHNHCSSYFSAVCFETVTNFVFAMKSMSIQCSLKKLLVSAN